MSEMNKPRITSESLIGPTYFEVSTTTPTASEDVGLPPRPNPVFCDYYPTQALYEKKEVDIWMDKVERRLIEARKELARLTERLDDAENVRQLSVAGVVRDTSQASGWRNECAEKSSAQAEPVGDVKLPPSNVDPANYQTYQSNADYWIDLSQTRERQLLTALKEIERLKSAAPSIPEGRNGWVDTPTEQASYWYWDRNPESAPFIYSIMASLSGAATRYFIAYPDTRWCDGVDGLWLKIEKPALPAPITSADNEKKGR